MEEIYGGFVVNGLMLLLELLYATVLYYINKVRRCTVASDRFADEYPRSGTRPQSANFKIWSHRGVAGRLTTRHVLIAVSLEHANERFGAARQFVCSMC